VRVIPYEYLARARRRGGTRLNGPTPSSDWPPTRRAREINPHPRPDRLHLFSACVAGEIYPPVPTPAWPSAPPARRVGSTIETLAGRIIISLPPASRGRMFDETTEKGQEFFSSRATRARPGDAPEIARELRLVPRASRGTGRRWRTLARPGVARPELPLPHPAPRRWRRDRPCRKIGPHFEVDPRPPPPARLPRSAYPHRV